MLEFPEVLTFVQNFKIETDVQYLRDLTGLQSSRYGPLRHHHQRRVLGDYEHAIDGLIQLATLMRMLGIPHLDIILEAQLNFLEQGYFEKAAACIRYASDPINLQGRTFDDDLMRNSTTACIVTVSAYAGCFVRGNWDYNLLIVSQLFYRFCQPSDTADAPKNDLDELLNRVRH